MKQYHTAALGGTFDRLHIGHHHLIATALDASSQLIIGLTTDTLLSDKEFREVILPYQDRLQELQAYLRTIKALDRVTVVPLTDPYGPTITNGHIDVLVVSQQTKPGAIAINQKRQQHNQPPLPIIVADLIKDEEGRYISSTRIRAGRINRQGQVYRHVFTTDIKPSPMIKNQIKKPQGQLFPSHQAVPTVANAPAIILVGDEVASSFIRSNKSFTHVIFDNRSRRHPVSSPELPSDFTVTTAINPPGVIAASAAQKAFSLLDAPRQALQIQGEEDLLAFPAFLAAPLQSHLFYGQPGEGIVMMTVTEAGKNRLVSLLKEKHENNID